MDTCNKISRYMQAHDWDCRVMGVPKTIDNDLFGTDHCPGFASAAKYIATSCMEVSKDCRVYDTGTITVVEIMGRHAGWLAGSAALASACGSGPDLIYLPEVDFDMEQFLADVHRIYEEKNNVLIAVSEGIHYADGSFVSEAKASATDGFGHAQLGGLAARLAQVIKEHEHAKVRCSARARISPLRQISTKRLPPVRWLSRRRSPARPARWSRLSASWQTVSMPAA